MFFVLLDYLFCHGNSLQSWIAQNQEGKSLASTDFAVSVPLPSSWEARDFRLGENLTAINLKHKLYFLSQRTRMVILFFILVLMIPFYSLSLK